MFILYLAISSAYADYHYGNSQYDALSTKLTHVLNINPSDITRQQIEEINNQFASLPRSEAPVEDLREMKFHLQYWRKTTAEKIMATTRQETNVDQLIAQLEALTALRFTLSAESIDLLVALPLITQESAAAAEMVELLSQQGQGVALDKMQQQLSLDLSKFSLALAGPRANVPIMPLMPSKFPFELWSEEEEFDHYAYPDSSSNNTILYKGMVLKAGDFILMNTNDSGDANFSSIGNERAYVSHFGIVAFLERNQKRYPVGIEMHRDGLRAVPLSRFLSRDFAAYLEIYRLRGMNEQWGDRINVAVAEELNKPRGYDFHSQEVDRRYLNCVTVGSLFLELSGVELFEPKTTVREDILDDLAKMGLHYELLLTPTDIVRSPRVDFVGTMDQGRYNELLARDLTAGQLVGIFNEGTVDFSRAPLIYNFYRWSVAQIKKDNIFGKLILKLENMDRGNLPNGSNELIAWVTPFENRYNKLVEKALPLLIPRIEKLGPSLSEIQNDPEIRKILQDHSKKLRKLFSETDD